MASAVTQVEGTDGTRVTSPSFRINRGVVQGDITSPLYFILALELILRTHDNVEGKGVQFEGHNVHTLGYADDAALLDHDINVAAARVNSIARGSTKDADMKINAGKTELMHVMEQGRVAAATAAEAKSVCKHKCSNVGCNKAFLNAHGCKCHMGKCKWKKFYVVDRILAVRGELGSPRRRFRVQWQGYGAEHNSWEPRQNLPPGMINDYLLANNEYEHNWVGERCPHCDKPCRSERGVKTHLRWCHWKPDEQNFKGTCAAKKVKQMKLAEAQLTKATIHCGDDELKNVFAFKYLGSIFCADGNQERDVKRRIALATVRMGELRHVFDADIKLGLKMKIYKTAICSLLTYGSEAWDLDEASAAMINGANARLLSRFTGKDAHAEASARTRSYDLVQAIRLRRFKWVGHIMRMDGDRLVKLAVQSQFKHEYEGSMLSDLPDHMKYNDIVQAAQQRKLWKSMASNIGDKYMMTKCIEDFQEDHPEVTMNSPRVSAGRPTHTYSLRPRARPDSANTEPDSANTEMTETPTAGATTTTTISIGTLSAAIQAVIATAPATLTLTPPATLTPNPAQDSDDEVWLAPTANAADDDTTDTDDDHDWHAPNADSDTDTDDDDCHGHAPTADAADDDTTDTDDTMDSDDEAIAWPTPTHETPAVRRRAHRAIGQHQW